MNPTKKIIYCTCGNSELEFRNGRPTRARDLPCVTCGRKEWSDTPPAKVVAPTKPPPPSKRG